MRFTIQYLYFVKPSAETEKNVERAVTSGIRDADDTLTSDPREDAIAVGHRHQAAILAFFCSHKISKAASECCKIISKNAAPAPMMKQSSCRAGYRR